MISEIDVNHDGELSFGEFLASVTPMICKAVFFCAGVYIFNTK